MKPSLILLFSFVFSQMLLGQSTFLIEAESFPLPGGWKVDQQFIEQMGSSYLIAHGSGQAVADAVAEIKLPQSGTYHVWARTKNWVPGNWEPPGQFRINVDGVDLANNLGLSPGWGWEYAGTVNYQGKSLRLSLRDLTGFDGRCDAIFFSQDKSSPPPDGGEKLASWRLEHSGAPEAPEMTKEYDLVVTGGGIAGCAAAMTWPALPISTCF